MLPISSSSNFVKWPKYASGLKFASNSGWFWVRRLFKVCVRVFCAPNVKILIVYIPAKIKMSFIWKHYFFSKIGIFCKSIADPLPSIVQARTQLYSFGGRIKQVICQIRHELSATIHIIITSWKKRSAVLLKPNVASSSMWTKIRLTWSDNDRHWL